MPPSRKNVMTKDLDRNHPVTRKPVSDTTIKRPSRLTSALSTTSSVLVPCGNSPFPATNGSPSVMSSGEATARASLTVGNRNRVQKYNPNEPSSAAQTTSEL